MNQDLIILLLIIAFIAGLFLWAWWLHVQNKKRSSEIVKRIAVAILLAIPFLFVSFAIIIVSLWDCGLPRPDRNATGRFFTIINNTSAPLHASVQTAYSPGELEVLRDEGIDIDLEENFVTYRDILIPNEGRDFEKQYSFMIPIPFYDQNVKWPSELQIILTDSLGDRELWLSRDDIDSTMRACMQIVVTDSMLVSKPQMMIPDYIWWGQKGDDQ